MPGELKEFILQILLFWSFGISLTAKQPINIWLCDTLALLDRLDNITRNQDVLGCSEICINVICKHVEHVRIILTEKLPGAEKFKYKTW